jgi:hypothetical protein
MLIGIRELINSPSGVFSLICLASISIVTYHSPAIGAGGFVAFFGIVPATLAILEHLEERMK